MPQLRAEQIRNNKERIISMWEKRAQSEIPSAKGLKSLVLRADLPAVIDELSERLGFTDQSIKNSKKTNTPIELSLAKKHGRNRAYCANYIIHEVIQEYHILREVIFDILEEEREIPRAVRNTILSLIETGINEATKEFVKALRDVQQQFTMVLTHDLKNPITSAKAAGELILKNSESGICKKAASQIVKDLNRLNKMTQNLLDVGRIRAGQPFPLNLEKFDLVNLLSEIANSFEIVYPNRLKLEVDSHLFGNWSADELKRMLENLIINAFKYGLPTGIVLVSAHKLGDTVQIIVHNEGDPIPSTELPLLFQLYRRLKMTERKEGWGLGLILIKGIAEAHGGTVHVKSNKAEGTSFIINLPTNLSLMQSA